MLQRVKEVQESDLRMVGALARNIQRVLAVTQADIDAAAAQGKGWLVKRVVKVNDPLDNLRGGTQLVIKQNSIQPGQNVMRVLYAGSRKTVGPAVAPLSLPGAAAEDIMSLIAFGGIQQGGIPSDYTLLNGVTNGSGTYIDTGITPTVDDVEIEIRVKPTTGSWYILQSRASGGTIWGVSGFSSGATILLGWAGTGDLCQSSITRDPTHTYYVKATMKNGNATLYVKDETANTEDTNTNTYTSAMPSLPFWLYGNQNSDRVASGNTVYMARIKVGGVTVMDYVPALNPSNVVGFYDNATGNFKVSDAGTLTADQTIVPTPTAPMDIVCNNGVLKARHASGLPLGYTKIEYIESTGTQYIDTGVNNENCTTYGVRTRYEYTATTANSLCGNYESGTNKASFGQIYFAAGSSAVYSGIGNTPKVSISPITINTDYTDEFTIDTSTGTITRTLNGTTITETGLNFGTRSDRHSLLFACNTNSGAAQFGTEKIYYFQILKDGVLVFNGIPVKDSNNVVGMYDTVSGQFFTNQGTGDFVAGTAVSDPVEVYADGTVETLWMHGKNLFDYQGVTIEESKAIGADGSISNNSTVNLCASYIPVSPNTIYTFSGDVLGSSTSFFRVAQYKADQTFISRSEDSTGERSSYTFTTGTDTYYIRFHYINTADISTYQLEQGSQATPYEPYFNGGTATAEMLLKVGNYQDVQSIIDGVVTRKVGVKVLDGTEDWIKATGTPTRFYLVLPNGSYKNKESFTPYCTHCAGQPSGNGSADVVGDVTDGIGFYLGSNSQNFYELYIRFGSVTSITDATTLKAYLADQYAAGTPVVVIYPLTTPTTESVAGQTLQVQAGDNTLEITQAGMAGLELEVEYVEA